MWKRSLIRENKAAARVLLYLPLLLVLLALLFFDGAVEYSVDSGWLDTDYEELESVQLFQEFLRIDTTYATGNEIPGAEFLARHLEAAGIPVEIDRIGSRNANLWAVLQGEDPRPLVLHNHLDIEPVVAAESWLFPPFGGVIDGPFLYGRGAFDMKSLSIAQLVAMLELKRSGQTLTRSLGFLATGDEERDSRLGTLRWLQEHPERVAQIYGVLTEGGAVEAVSLDQVRFWGTEFLQKRFVDIWVCDGSRRRLEDLRSQLVAAPQGALQSPSEAVAEFLRAYGPSRGRPEVQMLLASPETILESPARGLLPNRMRSSLRNELVAFAVEEDPQGGYLLRLILHLLPNQEFESAFEELIPDRLSGFTYDIDIQHPPLPSSSLEHPLYLGIEAFMGETLPEVHHGPLFIPWNATDARFFRTFGITSYGFSPFWILSSDAVRMQGANERMPVPAFVNGVERYVALIKSLVTE
jgi:acetylornithine deacetylase/succinyl-diaminopimelate desuccinylase-like protein